MLSDNINALCDSHANEVLAMETQMFEKFFKRVEPKMDAAGASGGRGELAAAGSSRMEQGTSFSFSLFVSLRHNSSNGEQVPSTTDWTKRH